MVGGVYLNQFSLDFVKPCGSFRHLPSHVSSTRSAHSLVRILGLAPCYFARLQIDRAFLLSIWSRRDADPPDSWRARAKGGTPREKHVDRRKTEEASGVDMAVTGSQLLREIAQTDRRCPDGGQSTLHSQPNGCTQGNFTYQS
jgi:hypothetical protein